MTPRLSGSAQGKSFKVTFTSGFEREFSTGIQT